MMPIPQILRAVTKAVPEVLPHLSARAREALKAADLGSINAQYHDAITEAIIAYFEGGGVTASRNDFKQATITAFSDAFDEGWIDVGAELPIEDDAVDWLQNRINEEFTHIESIFEDMKQLRREAEFDYFSYATARADGYTSTLSSIYTQGKLMGSDNVVLEFGGKDGKENCNTCSRLMGQRHKIKWWLDRGLVPGQPGNENYDCKGYECEHYLFNPKTGEQYAV